MEENCRRCLLYEAGEKAADKGVKELLANIDEKEKVSSDVYKKRLILCKQCNFLISGMCLKCGCYVELRAALKNQDCPDFDNRKW